MKIKQDTLASDARTVDEKLPKGFWVGLWILIAALLVSGIVVLVIPAFKKNSPDAPTTAATDSTAKPRLSPHFVEATTGPVSDEIVVRGDEIVESKIHVSWGENTRLAFITTEPLIVVLKDSSEVTHEVRTVEKLVETKWPYFLARYQPTPWFWPDTQPLRFMRAKKGGEPFSVRIVIISNEQKNIVAPQFAMTDTTKQK